MLLNIKNYWAAYHREAIWVLFAYFKSGSKSNQRNFTWFPLGWRLDGGDNDEQWHPFPTQDYLANWLKKDALGWLFQLYFVLVFHLEESSITMDCTKIDVDIEVRTCNNATNN